MKRPPNFQIPSGSELDYILNNAWGNPIELATAPTSIGGELETNQWGWHSTNLYLNLGGVTRRIAFVNV